MQTFAISALSRRLSRKISLQFFNPTPFKKDSVEESGRGPAKRYKPEGLDVLCRTTNFSRKELQILYRGFKQECPLGVVDEEKFKQIYSQFFPDGGSDSYAHYVFNAFDHDRDGSANFEDFIMALSVLARGSEEDKLSWVFSLYDVNGDGVITREEIHDVVLAVYGLMGRSVQARNDADSAEDHVDRVFQKLDRNNEGAISIEEFITACKSDKTISESLKMFDTVI